MEFITAIALWCGTPNSHVGRDDVNECRKELSQCIEKNLGGFTQDKVRKCFYNTKIKDRRV